MFLQRDPGMKKKYYVLHQIKKNAVPLFFSTQNNLKIELNNIVKNIGQKPSQTWQNYKKKLAEPYQNQLIKSVNNDIFNANVYKNKAL